MRKKLFRTLAAAVLIGSMMSVPAWAESAVVTGSEVNLRAGPGTNYRIVDCLDRGTKVNVTDRSNGSWYAIEYDGQAGFMSASFLRFEDEEIPSWAIGDGDSSPAETPAPVQTESPVQAPAAQAPSGQAPTALQGEDAYVNAMYVRFRSGPGSDYSILGEYNRGKALQVVGYTGSWACCVIDGTMGYVYDAYVTLGSSSSGQAPAAAATATPRPTRQPAYDPYSETEWQDANEDEGAPSWAIGDGDSSPAAPAPSPSAVPAPSASPAASQQPAAQAGAVGTGFIDGNYVRFRTGPGTNFQIIDSYNYGQELTVTGTYGDWTACLIDGVFGYVHSNYVEITSYTAQAAPQPGSVTPAAPAATPAPAPAPTPTPVTAVENKQGYVSGNNVRMRAAASMSAKILGELYYGNQLTITGISGDWTAVVYDGQEGFIYSQYVREGSLTIAGNTVSGGSYTESGSSSSGSSGSSGTASLSGSSYEKGQQIAQFALQYVGYNYCWGGKDPSTGFDCSGLVYYTYQHFGYTLNRVAQDQARNGVAVSADELQPGDILCFYSGSSYIGHSGIYIGNGMFVHAQNSATGVVITELAGNYSDRGFEARRIV